MTSLSQQMDFNHFSQHADFAQNLMSNICGEHRLDTRCREALDFHYDGIRLPNRQMRIGSIRYGANVAINISNLKAYSISLPTYGSQTLNLRGARILSTPKKGLIVSNNDLQDLIIDKDCQKIQVVIPEHSLEMVLADLLDRPLDQPVIFNPEMQLDSVHLIDAWWKNVQHFLQFKSHYMGFHALNLLTEDYESFMIKAFLLSQESNYSTALAALSEPQHPAYLVKVRQFLIAHVHQDLCAEDLQRMAGVSKSKLYAEFQQAYGCSPMQFLKQYRLQQIYKILTQTGQQHSISISKLAYDWGFKHLSRFSQAYRDAYGESPSDTRRRRDQG